jgi:hypothetical protein
MTRQLTTSRASRNRRLVAMLVWLGLIVTAMVLWNSRTQHLAISNPSEPVAFLLAAFTTFVSLFAWMLFNPARGVSAETTTLTLAGAATLFPPCIIAFCTMPPDSPLSVWLTFGLFILLVIAVMSPVPEEFFGIPRDRRSYVRQVSMAGLGAQSVLDLHPNWLKSTDFTAVVDESDRPSLAPSSWRDQEQLLPRTERRRRIEPQQPEKKEPTKQRPTEKRKGVFSRLRDRATLLRDAAYPSEQASQSTQSSLRTPPARERSTQPKQDSAERRAVPPPIPVVPIPFDPPAPPTVANFYAPPVDSSAGIPLAETRPAIRKDRFPKSRDDRRSKRPVEPAKNQRDPFSEDTSQRDETTSIPHTDRSAGQSQTQDDLQIADHSRQGGFERITDELGGEMIEGTVTIRFNRGQKRANVHVPFSPPLSGTPEVECDAIDDESVRVKVPERRAWGLRIEGRRTDTSTIHESYISFSAVYVPTR